jgi:drug/metabolite transporter (DMT)-like permease
VGLVLASAACYATLPAVVKIAYDHGADAAGVLALRFGIAAPILLAWVLLRRAGAEIRTAMPRLAVPALIYFVQTFAFFECLERMSAVTGVLILFSYPLLVAAGGAIVLGEKLTPQTLCLIGLGLVGVVLSVGLGGHGSAVGVALGIGSSVSFAVFFLMAKRLMTASDVDGVTLTALAYAVSGIAFPALMLVTDASAPSDRTGWLAIAVISLVGTVVAAVLLFSGLRHLSAATAGMLSSAEPPIAVALAALLLSEAVTAMQMVGMAIVVLALGRLSYVATRSVAAELPAGP